MIYLVGQVALSDFRRQQLLASLQQQVPAITDLTAHYCYFMMGKDTLDSTAILQLEHLLQAKRIAADSHDDNFIVIPRLGTLSPWSSKATDIIHHCGLQDIQRVERGIRYQLSGIESHNELSHLLYDRMTETFIHEPADARALFAEYPPQALKIIPILKQGKQALIDINQQLGLALSDDEIDYLMTAYQSRQRDPSDVELMMFAQANSEHCRHKIFNADWIIDNKPQQKTLFSMIRNTYDNNPEGILSAYHDNAAVIEGAQSKRLMIKNNQYQFDNDAIDIVMKVETHNHPTAIAPHPGAATGSGGEIRDEAATGRGAKSKAGLVGFSVSHLHIPDFQQAWEYHFNKPDTIVSALDIMLQAPVGAASFSNEFGRPSLCGYFRSFAYQDSQGTCYGYHKPIMLAGGLGNISRQHVDKKNLHHGALLIVLGGPAMQIGLGGGAASSMASGQSKVELDYASVQRSNPEMQRRAQEVIDHCWMRAENNPILSIHDVGAGGLANAFPELVNDSNCGGDFQLRAIPNAEPGMSPLAIWCNEAQERFVLAIDEQALTEFVAIADREACPYAIVGKVNKEKHLRVSDEHFANHPIDIANEVVLGKPPKMLREVKRQQRHQESFDDSSISIVDAAKKVLQHPTVASKQFLITIGDRSVGGLVARDQMVGPWQVPVADCAVTAAGFSTYQGEAMAIGERSPLAIINPQASARMAVAEAITNIAAAAINDLSSIKLSANWMAACGDQGQDEALYDAVKAVGMELCPALGIAIPVGKDSLSMRTVWQQEDKTHSVRSPLSLNISAFAPVDDIRQTLTPQLIKEADSQLWFIDLAAGQTRLGGSVLAQVYQQMGSECPDVDEAKRLAGFFAAIQQLNKQDLLLAYHDRSDGGLFATLCEMAFAGHVGIDADLSDFDNALATLFNEELGAVIQVRHEDIDAVRGVLTQHQLVSHCYPIGKLNDTDTLNFIAKQQVVFSESRKTCQQWWSEPSYRLQALRDNPQCAEQEFALLDNDENPGLQAKVPFVIPKADIIEAAMIAKHNKPKIAILREQGVNGHQEMAAAFMHAGFDCHDVHLNDLLPADSDLSTFQGLAVCGGFSYGDVLGAGRGWANKILYQPKLRDAFSEFFLRQDSFALGVCNGCQMLSQLRELIPGTEHWPLFLANESAQFEARLSLVEVLPSPSIFLQDMAGAHLPVPVSHGEGRAHWPKNASQQVAEQQQLMALRYVNHDGQATTAYPANPNGSPDGVTALTNQDGRVTIMMPHPERAFRSTQLSWAADEWDDYSPWMKMFLNARQAC